ncbi:MAG: M48 family metalloprotease [Myxococcales bacterium]|nr:M48 family metalloprotease [Myxococcales bacterium]
MALGSIIGFGLVFVLVAWTGSAVASLTLSLFAERLRGQGAAGEKRAAELALVLPPLLGVVVAASLAMYSVFPGLLGGVDHCDTHGHHLHLCLVHGGEWSSRAWAVALISGLSALAFVRAVQLIEATLRGRRRLQAIERSSERIEDGEVPVFRVPSNRPFCFVAGLRSPRIFVASSLWDDSSEETRMAMLGHERGHIENGDIGRSTVLSFSSLFGAPILASQFKLLWADAAERLCDRISADSSGDSTTLASALVNIVRLPQSLVGLSFVPEAGSVENRVVAILTQERTGHAMATRLLRIAVALVAAVTITSAVLADPLHHALESLFGLV